MCDKFDDWQFGPGCRRQTGGGRQSNVYRSSVIVWQSIRNGLDPRRALRYCTSWSKSQITIGLFCMCTLSGPKIGSMTARLLWVNCAARKGMSMMMMFTRVCFTMIIVLLFVNNYLFRHFTGGGDS